MFKFIRFLITHGFALVLGIALGIYLLPILVAPEGPSDAEVSSSAQFRKDLPGSDFLHWGEGTISISAKQIGFMGSLAPGPDYRLYLTRNLVLTEREFLNVKNESVVVGEVKTFSNFILPMPDSINPSEYSAVVVWCESFGEFITAAKYQ
jgi:hypothetical protein